MTQKFLINHMKSVEKTVLLLEVPIEATVSSDVKVVRKRHETSIKM